MRLDFLEGKRVWVSGAAGFIGWKVSEFLLDAGAEVVGVDNLNDYYSPLLKMWRVGRLRENKKFTFVKGDIEDIGSVERTLKDVDVVINLAARAGVRASISNPWVYVSTNITGMINVLEVMRKRDISKGVLASSSSVYAGSELPFKESNVIDTPLNVYATTKRAGELLAYNYHHLYGISTSVLRYFTVYGPAGRPDMAIFKFTKNIMKGREIEVYGDGTQKRDFTYVDDVAIATLLSINLKGYEVLNVGNDNPVELNYVISLIEKNLGKKARITYKEREKADMKDTWADISKIKRMLKWEPQVKIEEGIKRVVEWARKERELLNKI